MCKVQLAIGAKALRLLMGALPAKNRGLNLGSTSCMVLSAHTQKRSDRFPGGRCPCGRARAETALAELGKRDRRGR